MFNLKNILAAGVLMMATVAGAAESVDINSASAEEIAKALNGVGLARAQAIVEYRDAHGRFKSADELTNIKGIGLKMVERNRAVITLGKK